MQPRIYKSVVNLTALSRDAADDVTWVHTASNIFLHSQLKRFDYVCVVTVACMIPYQQQSLQTFSNKK